jgi:hypothetical protein
MTLKAASLLGLVPAVLVARIILVQLHASLVIHCGHTLLQVKLGFFGGGGSGPLLGGDWDL